MTLVTSCRLFDEGNEVLLPATDAIRRDNFSAWRCYVAADTDLVNLTRWGHQQPGMLWETFRFQSSMCGLRNWS